jgi:hypothetical protein
MENGKKPAFQSSIGLSSAEIKELGLTKREYFAGLAMQGLLSNPNKTSNPIQISLDAVMYADELLKQLSND